MHTLKIIITFLPTLLLFSVFNDDFQSILHSLGTPLHCESHLMKCESLLSVMNHIPYHFIL